ncbi:type IV conjugative transfer system lipoprotein TraV [Scandinavium sp. NPDC088450]|uniref:type IV conjugative transfer system lipoprotein TraV n=1 Tax=Scandinavium sp. NPDC088450 TaxID=3364514 RepID=UPI0038516C66
MKNLFSAAVICSALAGCAGMNSDFDCNKTTTDQCLTMTEANKLAAQGKSLDDLSAGTPVKKPAGEPLPALQNTAPGVSPYRPVSVAATGIPAVKPLTTTSTVSSLTGKPVAPVLLVGPAPRSNDAGRVVAQRIPDATQRLWVAPWIDTDDNLHQPAVVEFVKNKSHWDQDYRVISEGDD